MGLYYDKRNRYIHSISKDKRYKVLNARLKELVAGDIKWFKLDFTPG